MQRVREARNSRRLSRFSKKAWTSAPSSAAFLDGPEGAKGSPPQLSRAERASLFPRHGERWGISQAVSPEIEGTARDRGRGRRPRSAFPHSFESARVAWKRPSPGGPNSFPSIPGEPGKEKTT